jgi:hypothetical protein
MPTTRGREDLSHLPCRNCGDPREGTFCPECGQRKVEVRTTVRQLMQEVVTSQFSLDGKLPQTFKALFFTPGALTLAYLNGQGKRYVHPFRLYLFNSLMFFLLLGISGTGSGVSPDAGSAAQDGGEQGARAETVWELLDIESPEGESPGVQINLGILNRMLEVRARELMAMDPIEAGQALSGALIRNTPTLLFLLLPAFAGVFSLAYWRLRRFYAEHFIHVLHLHAFVFFTFSVQKLLTLVHLGWVNGFIQLWLWLYLFLALRRVYGQGRRTSLFKLGLIATGYLGVLLAALPFLVLGSLIFWG